LGTYLADTEASPSHPTGPVTIFLQKRCKRTFNTLWGAYIKDEPDDIVKIVREDVIST